MVHYEVMNRQHGIDLYSRYGDGKWRCVRHSQTEEVLTPQNRKRVTEIVSREESTGRYFGHWGFLKGLGYKVFADDLPPGTRLRVTAEVTLPETPTKKPESTDLSSIFDDIAPVTLMITEDEDDLLHDLKDRYWKDFSKLVSAYLSAAPEHLRDNLAMMMQESSSVYGADWDIKERSTSGEE
jgi:hypothetical protein